MKSLSIEQANRYLRSIGMQLNNWNQVVDAQEGTGSYVTYEAPKDARQLLNFSQHVTGWLPVGDWKFLQLDNSARFDPVQAAFVGQLMSGPNGCADFSSSRGFLFEFGDSEVANGSKELLIADLVFLFLLFESHAYLVSSGSELGQVLAIQDGFLHFASRDATCAGADLLLRRFEREPLSAPKWIIDIIASRQEMMGSVEHPANSGA